MKIRPILFAILLGCPLSFVLGQSLEFGPPVIVESNFLAPNGLALDLVNDKIFVANTGEHKIEWTDLTTITASPIWAEFGFVADRTNASALNEPQGVAIDASGNAFVADAFNNEVKLYRWDATTSTYTYDANFASTTRNALSGIDFEFPRDIAIAPDGKIYLLDSGNDRILVADDANDTSWQLWRSNPDWGNPYGIDVADDGSVFIADTDNHRIVKISGAAETYFGIFGRGNSQFRGPRDVAVGTDGRIYVADTYNHRIVILNADGSHYRNLGRAPLFGTLQKIEVNDETQIFVIDADNNQLIAFLGPEVAPPFDAYLRDYVGDPGGQPSNDGFVLSSPDILIRHAPDVDLEVAENLGLTSYAFQQPRYDHNNYIYIAVHNRGTNPINNTIGKLYWIDPGSPINFPDDWSSAGFYQHYLNPTNNTLSNTLSIPSVAASTEVGGVTVDGVTVVGPIIWRPPTPESAIAGDGDFYLATRLVNIYDSSEAADGITQVRLNNNIAVRKAAVSRGPFPIGEQNTLVVGVEFADIPTAVDETNAMNKVMAAGTWIEEVSYGLTTIDPYYAGSITLDDGRPFYDQANQSLLIEMTTEVLNKLVTGQPDILNGPTANTEDDIDRLIFVVNDNTFTEDWATTGNWAYDLSSGERKYLSVSIQGPNNSAETFAHGISHQLGLRDLYPYDNVSFPADFRAATGWDNMSELVNGAHPLVWSKEHVTWLTSVGAKIHYIARPPVGSPIAGEPPLLVSFQSILETDEIGAIAIGLTPGVTTFEEETHFYWVESRSKDLGNADHVAYANGVLIYYANKQIPQGHAPVIIRDNNAGTVGLNDAVYLPPGDSESPGGTGITITVLAEEADDGGYQVRVDYDPPATDYDVYLNEGDPVWTSPDIWADNQITGGGYHSYDAILKKSGGPVDEAPVGGEENRIYARVHNRGPATAYDIEVQFHFSAPYHTVGGEGSFDFYKSVFIGELPPEDYKDVYVIWEPLAEGDPHNCVKVKLLRMTNDVNDANDEAQQNLRAISADQASPYPEVAFPFHITNEEDQTRLVYFRAEGIPKDWASSISPAKALLAKDQKINAVLKITPKEGEPPCTNHEISVRAWTPENHTIIPMGGATVDLQLRNKTNIRFKPSLRDCNDNRYVSAVNLSSNFQFAGTRENKAVADNPGNEPVATVYNKEGYLFYLQWIAGILNDPQQGADNEEEKPVERGCMEIISAGCTNPKRPNAKIVLRYEDAAGNPIYKEVTTDANGCFEDFHVVVEGGDWEVTAIYPGDDCNGRGSSSFGVYVPVPVTGDQDGDGVLDEDETQGDHDGDGRPNHLDSDSDGDGIPDGEEPEGDADGDGLDNRNDPDSDDDGILDGEDDSPYGEETNEEEPSWTFGSYFGQLIFDDDIKIKDNLTFGLRANYHFSRLWALQGELGWTPTTDSESIYGTVFNTNLNALYFIRKGNQSKYDIYLTAGAGGMFFNGFSSDENSFAVNGGLGLIIPLKPRISVNLDVRVFNGSPIYQSDGWHLDYRGIIALRGHF